MTREEFIEKARKVHGNKYDYSKVEYKNNREKVCIICPIHGEFMKSPYKHLNGQGCPRCSIEKMSNRFSDNINEFIKKAEKIHNNKYDYSKSIYKNTKTKICIICPKHGEFWQAPYSHLSGAGCNKCAKEKLSMLYRSNNEEFIRKSNIIHNFKYDYSKVEYINNHTPVIIICPIHGEFKQIPNSHLNGNGCPKCAEQKNISENRLYKFISSNTELNIIKQYKPKWLNKKSLDIFIKDLNVAIEHQGEQHFVPKAHFGGDKQFKIQKQRDIDKYNACKEHGVKLLYFSYDKNVPSDYIDKVYTDENELLEIINNLKNNSK